MTQVALSTVGGSPCSTTGTLTDGVFNTTVGTRWWRLSRVTAQLGWRAERNQSVYLGDERGRVQVVK